MYRVLIADDELLVRVGLKTTIDWEGNGFTVIGEAKNGSEALELCDRHQPDILLTDVCMPDLNGLELIKKLKQQQDNLKSIILTHHDDFNYAHQAINLGVIGYILKSNLTEEILLVHLKKAAEMLSPRQEEWENDSDPALIARAIKGGRLSEDQIKGLKLASFPNNYYQIVLMQFHFDEVDSEVQQRKILNFEKVIISISNQVFNECDFTILPLVQENAAVYIFNMSGATASHVRHETLLNIVHHLRKSIKKYLNLNISIGISSQSNSFNALPKLYAEAQQACSESFFEPGNVSIFFQSSVGYIQAKDTFDVKELNLLLANKNVSGLKSFLYHHFLEIQKKHNTRCLLDDFNTITANLRDLITDSDPSQGKIVPRIESEGELLNQFYNISALTQYLTDLHVEYVKNTADKKSSAYNSHIIRKSMEYIRQHAAENISLQTVADNAEVSRSYLSFLFKQELGINFSTYMTEIRIEKAKTMLTSSNMKIYEIAEKVGFDSPYYFSKVFRDTCGMTCKQYRSTHYIPGQSA